MSNLNVTKKIVSMFCNAVILPVLTYACIAFYNLLTKDYKCKLCKPRKICGKILRNDLNLDNVADTYVKSLMDFAVKIAKDNTHPLHHELVLLPSGRRWRAIAARTTRYRSTCIPCAIRTLNSHHIVI